MGQTIVEKISQAHMSEGPNRPLRAGDFLSIRPYHVMTHDNTSAVMKKFKAIGAKRVHDPAQPVFTADHDIQNTEESNLAKYRSMEAFARERRIDFYPPDTGIGHQIMVEQGYVLPGTFVVASDSHSNMYGALGAIGTPVVRTDAAAIWATGEFWWQVPRTVQVVLEGKLAPGVTGKDVIVTLCGLYNSEEVLNAAVEFSGPGVASLSMDARLSIANMSTEWGALVGWFPVDEVTLAYLEARNRELRAQGVARIPEEKFAAWRNNPAAPDKDAVYGARIVLDLAEVTPHVSGPDTVQVMQSVAEIAKKKVAIQKAYLVSCVNSRLEDLEAAAKVLRGKKIADGVKFYLAAASRSVQEEAEKRGIWQTFLDAGAQPLPSGCGPCIGLGTGLLEAGEVGISATNRNFKGRMGSRDAQCYLASPEVVAASAVAGYICGPGQPQYRELTRRFEEFPVASANTEKVEILPGFPASVRGRLVFLPQDNLNTDGIYGKDYTYREDMTPEMMARVVMENYDPQFAERTLEGDVVVGGFNFGTGSSREQAVTALKCKGIPLVIAGSFSQTYLRNAFNNGFLCIETPELVNRLRAKFEEAGARKEKTIIPGDVIEVDFAASTIHYEREQFTFPALGSVPQSLVIAGGVENLVSRKLGLNAAVAQMHSSHIVGHDAFIKDYAHMPKHTIVTMPGDGIGNQVLREAIRVLDAVGFEADYVHADIGWECWIKEGNALSDRTLDLLRQHKVGLFGAITSKPKKEAEAELNPSLRGKSHQYFSPIVSMRQKFNLDVCMRPCLSFPGNPLNFIRKKPAGGFEEPKVDVVVFRQNTEGLYAGVEWTNPPELVREALNTNPKFKPFEKVAGEDLAISVRIITRPAARRICEAAFQHARKFGYKAVTICEKPNVLRETSGMMEEVAKEVQKKYSDIPLWSTNIDAQTMWLTKNPEDYGVIVASNLFGDVISDAFAGLVGGLGFAASGNIGDEVAVFEPTHGSAPKYAELDPPIVNPIAMILSAAMMLDHIGENGGAEKIRSAIAAVVAEGKVRSYDMMRLTGGAKSLAQGAASTTQMTDAILAKLGAGVAAVAGVV